MALVPESRDSFRKLACIQAAKPCAFVCEVESGERERERQRQRHWEREREREQVTHLNCMASTGECRGMIRKIADVCALHPDARWALVYIAASVHRPQSYPFCWVAFVWIVTVAGSVGLTMSSHLAYRMGSSARRGSAYVTASVSV